VGARKEGRKSDPLSCERDQAGGDEVEARALKQILAEQSPKNAVDLRVEMGWHRDSLTADRGDCRFATA